MADATTTEGGTGTTQTTTEKDPTTRLGAGTEGAAGTQTGEQKKDGGEAGAQESTDLKLKFPEGLDEKVQKTFTELAKKHGFKSESAQEALDFAVKFVTDREAETEAAVKSGREKLLNEWVEAMRTDKEFGGADIKKNLDIANSAAMKFGGEELIKVLGRSGLNNHPDVVRAFYRIGKAISEDSIRGTTGGEHQKMELSRAEQIKALFPNSPEMWEKEK